eukprot:CAMPEP_0197700884 /NCGR_PEP_ID=MMETSP1338-20131121/122533_1 /TAXON_ID=43686 ORGANISM="Pelagodinium beii, Strain RCC1491" /NCGR_SAMPLE_ID=MMETSP1338 /ASSEMBLY_ACC=CAM_ASM_000754 /LENGTH=195 /DNA_ID=CAMNT_0043284533 /DNA_START=1 /DNA_END=585 /DNA_ORIENTATION=+
MHSRKHEDLDKQLETVLRENNGFKKRCAELEGNHGVLQQQVESASREKSEHEKRLGELQVKQHLLERDLDTALQERDLHFDKLNDLQMTHEGLQEKWAAAQKEISQHKQAFADLEDQRQSLMNQLEPALTQQHELQERCRSLEQLLQGSNPGQLTDLQKQVHDFQLQLNEAWKERDRIADQLRSLQDEHAKVKEQ